MKRLREAGATLATAGIFLAGCSAAEQGGYPSPSDSSSSSPYEYPVPAPAATPQAPETTTNTASAAEIDQRLQAILVEACKFVVAQEAYVQDGGPDILYQGSPLYDYSNQYEALADPQGNSGEDEFDLGMKQSCQPYAEIHSKNNG